MAPESSEEIEGPRSTWLGHATLFLNMLLTSDSGKKTRVNFIVDPLDHDLTLLYKRKTKFAKPVEELPTPHVYLLSHNHVDHFSKPTIKKLLEHQPMIVVPLGDGHRYTELGFENVSELDWWESQEIKFKVGEEKFTTKVTATPARHWAGQGPCGGHDSTFLGYVIGDDTYIAGDTARLMPEHVKKLREKFNIKWMFQPGGPDEVRKDMETTHQASVDALWMHVELLLKKIFLVEGPDLIDKEKFREEALKQKTVFMHTMTYRLGNLHLSDTKDSVSRVLDALDSSDQIETSLTQAIKDKTKAKADLIGALGDSQKRKARKERARLQKEIVELNLRRGPAFEGLVESTLGLKSYEWQVYSELKKFCEETNFTNEEKLTTQELSEILRDTAVIPKIGSRLELGDTKANQKGKLYDNFMRKGDNEGDVGGDVVQGQPHPNDPELEINE